LGSEPGQLPGPAVPAVVAPDRGRGRRRDRRRWPCTQGKALAVFCEVGCEVSPVTLPSRSHRSCHFVPPRDLPGGKWSFAILPGTVAISVCDTKTCLACCRLHPEGDMATAKLHTSRRSSGSWEGSGPTGRGQARPLRVPREKCPILTRHGCPIFNRRLHPAAIAPGPLSAKRHPVDTIKHMDAMMHMFCCIINLTFNGNNLLLDIHITNAYG